MDLLSWALFALAITVATISPGSNVLIVVTNALKFGSKGAAYTILGNLSCLFLIALMASLGIGAILQSMPLAYTIMKVAGGAYLIWLGIKLIRNSLNASKSVSLHHKERSSEAVKPKAVFLEAFLISASNPKSILFLSAVFPQFLNIEQAVVPQFIIMFTTIIFIVGTIHSLYAFISLKMKGIAVSSSLAKSLSRITGITFIGMGTSLAFSK